MAQAQQNISMDSVTLGCIALAERPTTPVNEANVAALKAFERLRAKGISLTELLASKSVATAPNQSSSILLMEKLQLAAEVTDLQTKLAGAQGKLAGMQEKVSSLSEKLAAAKNEVRELRDANKSVGTKVSDAVASALKANKAEMAAMKRELKSAHAQAAADRPKLAAKCAKPAPMSAKDVASTRPAKPAASASAAVAPAPNPPVSAPAAPASISKRSKGALKAWVTRRANAAANAHTAASAVPKAQKAPRTGSLRAGVL